MAKTRSCKSEPSEKSDRVKIEKNEENGTTATNKSLKVKTAKVKNNGNSINIQKQAKINNKTEEKPNFKSDEVVTNKTKGIGTKTVNKTLNGKSSSVGITKDKSKDETVKTQKQITLNNKFANKTSLDVQKPSQNAVMINTNKPNINHNFVTTISKSKTDLDTKEKSLPLKTSNINQSKISAKTKTEVKPQKEVSKEEVIKTNGVNNKNDNTVNKNSNGFDNHSKKNNNFILNKKRSSLIPKNADVPEQEPKNTNG